MKLKFKHQRFQEEAAKAVCDVFAGQRLENVLENIEILGLFNRKTIKKRTVGAKNRHTTD